MNGFYGMYGDDCQSVSGRFTYVVVEESPNVVILLTLDDYDA